MNRNKIILYVLLAVFVMQAEVAVGRPNRNELKSLLAEALKIDECVRIVRVQRPIPLRFRRGIPDNEYQCTIRLD